MLSSHFQAESTSSLAVKPPTTLGAEMTEEEFQRTIFHPSSTTEEEDNGENPDEV